MVWLASWGLEAADLSLLLGEGGLPGRLAVGLTPCPCSAQVKCCGWVSFSNWTDNAELMNHTDVTYPCSCEVTEDEDTTFLLRKGFCQAPGNSTQGSNDPEEWPVYREVCAGLWER